MPDRSQPDTVVAIVLSPALPNLLTNLHRNGYGPVTRVIDSARGDLDGQLRRAGLELQGLLEAPDAPFAVVLVHAPNRTEQVANLLRDHGSRNVTTLRRIDAVSTTMNGFATRAYLAIQPDASLDSPIE